MEVSALLQLELTCSTLIRRMSHNSTKAACPASQSTTTPILSVSISQRAPHARGYLQFLQEAANKYLGGEQGNQGHSGGQGLDWSNLSAMADRFGKADEHTGDQEVEPSTFKKL